MSEVSFTTLETAYWQHLKSNGKSSPFIYEGVKYDRSAYPNKSNSGKTIVSWSVRYQGDDGAVISNGPQMLNRRHDPERNWGLGRD